MSLRASNGAFRQFTVFQKLPTPTGRAYATGAVATRGEAARTLGAEATATCLTGAELRAAFTGRDVAEGEATCRPARAAVSDAAATERVFALPLAAAATLG